MLKDSSSCSPSILNYNQRNKITNSRSFSLKNSWDPYPYRYKDKKTETVNKYYRQNIRKGRFSLSKGGNNFKDRSSS